MRRASRGKKRYSNHGSRDHGGLTGRDIGLFYRARQMEKKNIKNMIRLRIPQPIMSAVRDSIQKIEKIARKEHIYLSPKKLEFAIKPALGADFIPLKPTGADKESHHITNIFPRDDDIIYVQTEHVKDECDVQIVDANIKNEPISFSKFIDAKKKAIKDNYATDSFEDVMFVTSEKEAMLVSDSSEVISIDIDKDVLQDKSTIAILNKSVIRDKDNVSKSEIKSEDVVIINDSDGDLRPVKSEDKMNVSGFSAADAISIDSDEDDLVHSANASYSVSNKYAASTSRVTDVTTDYKYGYDDIITGTFEEKLDESLKQGIAINSKSETIVALNEVLRDEYNIMVKDRPKYKEMMKFRETLPTYKKTKDLLKVINDNQVIVISGETGCGKSTQVPQIILDDAIKNNRGGNVKILVTEPRRIAASSLAMRVAEERAEQMGKSVGYAVRLEKVECRPRASINFCTTGVLLVELEVNQSLSNYSHIILDEVHERDCQIDISMCMLRQVLKKRKDLKLILMSATIDAENLSAYYDNCPMLHIEGLAFPVKDIYLEDILQMTHFQLLPDERNMMKQPAKPWMKHTSRFKKGQEMASKQFEKDIQYHYEIAPWLESIKGKIDKDVYETLKDRRIETLNIDLILSLLKTITKLDPGAILVFVPGIAEISKLIQKMQDSHQFPESRFEIHPLHSKLPSLTQNKIFRRPPPHVRKIIVATNIAETSITIDDIVYVVDSGRVKYKGLNVENHVSTLKVEWVAQANLRQRRGRAGRCQPGVCFHLVTSYRAGKLLERHLPELQRDDLLEPVLQIKRLRLGLAEPALNMMPAVPDEKTIKNAVRHLQQCGALDDKETLTPLGWHMARLPVHPAAGKLLLLGALFGCLERAASVAAVWGFKDPFIICIGEERLVDGAKKNLALGEPSDHIAVSEAIIQYGLCESYSEKNAFANDHFLNKNTLKLLCEMKNQFGSNLKQMGFLRSGDVRSSWENRNTHNLSLFKAIVAASLYPNIATVKWINMNSRNPHKIPHIKAKTPADPQVAIHPGSVMSYKPHAKGYQTPLCSNPGANWLVYWLKQKSTDLYLIEVTLVYTLPLLFFGELNVTEGETPDQCLIDINTIKVCCDKETTQLLFEMRALLDKVLAAKITGGETKRSSEFEEHVLNAVIRMITAEDERTEYMDDGDGDQSESDYDNDRTRKW